MKTSDKEIIRTQLRWLNFFHSELCILDGLELSPEKHQEIMSLRRMAYVHFALHRSLLFDAFILGLASVLGTPGWNQKTKGSRTLTLQHFIQQLSNAQQKHHAMTLLDEARSWPSCAELWTARDKIIAHADLEFLRSYVGQPAHQAFPNLHLNDLGLLLRRAREIAFVAIDPLLDLSILDYVGVEELFRVLRQRRARGLSRRGAFK
jgi:hypothetical protein